MDNFLDILGQVLWFMMLAFPGVAIILWIRTKEKKFLTLVLYLFLALCLSAFFFMISMQILLRDGLGPG